jgi:hypothetical protein
MQLLHSHALPLGLTICVSLQYLLHGLLLWVDICRHSSTRVCLARHMFSSSGTRRRRETATIFTQYQHKHS